MFKPPFRMTVTGPSQSGKSCFTKNLILSKNLIVGADNGRGEPFTEIIWCCRNKNFVPPELKELLENLTIFEGVPDIASAVRPNSLIVIDDLMLEAFTKEVCELFTVQSHHKNISIILILQNLFTKNKLTRDISLNNQFIVFFKNPRDVTQFSILARQVCGKNYKALENVYKQVCSRPYGYLVIDLCQATPEFLKYKTNIFDNNHFDVFARADDVKQHSEAVIELEKEQIFIVCPITR